MSDFLTRLAERAQELAPLAQPWIAPRFARGPDSGSGPADVAAEPPASATTEVEEEAAVWRRLLERSMEPARPPRRSEPAAPPAPPAGPPGTVRLLAPRSARPPLRPIAPPPAAPPPIPVTPPPAPEPDAAPRPDPSLVEYLRRPRSGAR